MYTQSITRTHRTAIILAIDGSGSMAEKIRFRNRQMTKAEAVATITNGMLFELIERARRSDGVRDYYDIAVIGYSGDDEVYSLLPGGRELISVAELAAGEPPIKTEVIEYRLPDGSEPSGYAEMSVPADYADSSHVVPSVFISGTGGDRAWRDIDFDEAERKFAAAARRAAAFREGRPKLMQDEARRAAIRETRHRVCTAPF